MTMHPQWIVPRWHAPSHVRAVITTRAGGVSKGQYASLNLGVSVGDDPDHVAENRARVRAALPGNPVWLKQVHGNEVIDADADPLLPHADASVACLPGTVCAVQVADCIPVLFTDVKGSVVAAAHAGWRGLASGVLRNTLAALETRGAKAEDILAYIGPGIGPSAFEVGADVYDAFTASDPGASAAFVPLRSGKWLANLHALVQRALHDAGVTRVYGDPMCTVSDAVRFFSYRRDRITGRFAALIWRES